MTDNGSGFLAQQYEAALNLYQHEDNLNWAKLNALVSVVVFLGAGHAVLWFSCKPIDDTLAGFARGIYAGMAGGLWLLGFVIFLLFSLTLRCGGLYFRRRKEQLFNIERRVVAAGGIRLVLPPDEDEARSGLMRRSGTEWVISSFPVVIMFLWTCSSLALALFALFG